MTWRYQHFQDQFLRDLTSLGGFVFFGMVLLLYLALQQWNLFLQLLIGVMLTMIIVVLVRTVYFKNRPKKQNYRDFIERMDASSFPSWHTARIVFLSLQLAYFFNNLYVTLFTIFLAATVAYSRIYLKKHDWLDVSGGIVLGGLAFWLTTFLF